MGILTENRTIWDALARTDPAFTKEFTKGGGFRGTDVNPTWRIQRLTEQFGPQGKGWGWTIHSKWRETFGGVDCVFVEVSLWYMLDGARYEGSPQIGGTDCSRTPDEAYKMAVTDGFGKCAMALGLSADIYLKQFDASKYREEEAKKGRGRPQDARKETGAASTTTEAPKIAPTGESGPPRASYASPEQVKNAWKEAQRRGLGADDFQALVAKVTGAHKSTEIPAGKYLELLEAVAKW